MCQNRTCKPGAIFSAICRRDIAGVLNTVIFETRQKLHRVAAPKIASVNGPLGVSSTLQGVRYFLKFFVFRFKSISIETEALSMAFSTMYSIPQIVSFKWYTMCGPRVYSYCFTKYVAFPLE